jgi:hypothetical protein
MTRRVSPPKSWPRPWEWRRRGRQAGSWGSEREQLPGPWVSARRVARSSPESGLRAWGEGRRLWPLRAEPHRDSAAYSGSARGQREDGPELEPGGAAVFAGPLAAGGRVTALRNNHRICSREGDSSDTLNRRQTGPTAKAPGGYSLPGTSRNAGRCPPRRRSESHKRDTERTLSSLVHWTGLS